MRSFRQLSARSFPRKSFATSAAKKASSSLELPANLHSYPETKVTTLPNGLRVATEFSKSATSSVGIWINAGSRYETEAANGSAHFLEHMLFKGTPKMSQSALEQKVEDLGAHLNAYTSREQTVYYSRQFSQDTVQMLEILGDIVQNANINPKNVDIERDVIIREMQEVEKQTEEVVFDRLHESAFQDQGLGRTILGPVENILSLTETDLKNYVQTHYTPDRMVVVAAGESEHAQIVEAAERIFGNLPPAPSSPIELPPAHFVGSDVRIRNDEDPVAHLALAFESRGWTSPDSIAVMLLQTLLGSWEANSNLGANSVNILCNKVAEENLAHKLSSFNTSYTDTGLFGVYAVADPTCLQDLVWYILDSMVRLGHDTTEEELQRAKGQLLTMFMGQLDGTTQVCEDIGRQILTYGRRLTPAEIHARLDAVTLDELKKVAFDIINDRDLVQASVGPVHEMPDYNWSRRRTFWQRI